MNRPEELEDFFKKHGVPLEVGMIVNVGRNDPVKSKELEVKSIRPSHSGEKIVVELKTYLNFFHHQN